MGLDQYAYIAGRPGQQKEFWAGAEMNEEQEFVNPDVRKPEEIMYWRKHPNLQGWMENLWREKENPPTGESFCHELELTEEDLNKLEQDVLNGDLPGTEGFFFGDNSDEYYKEQDLKFIKEARKHLFFKFRVFYNSSW